MKIEIKCVLPLVVAAVLTAVSATSAIAQESALEKRLARLEAQWREQAATVKRHDSQLADLNAKADGTDEKLNKMLQIMEAMASRQLSAGNSSQIATAKSTQATPVSVRKPLTPQATTGIPREPESRSPRSAYDSARPNRRQYRYTRPGVVIVISGYSYSDEPYYGDEGLDTYESDYYSGGFKHVACR